MNGAGSRLAQLREQLEAAEAQVRLLKTQIAEAEKLEESRRKEQARRASRQWPLQPEEYERYSRQMILADVGVEGQLLLKHARVLVVGAGGLGCPAAAYLAGAGVGCIGIVDGDTVEASNLHRQIAHTTSRVGLSKASSLASYLRALNPLLEYELHEEHLSPQNAPEILANYDLVLDCTDNPATRYLISDTCVLLALPLVSASALRTDGQLIVLNYPAKSQGDTDGGPCYRCLYPKPPPAASIQSCGEAGVFGPAVGTMGVLQAGEAIKIILRGHHLGTSPPEEQTRFAPTCPAPSLLLFSSPLSGPPTVRTARMRRRRPDCWACSAQSRLTVESFRDGSREDYVQSCAGPPPPQFALAPEERLSAGEYATVRRAPAEEHLLLDVREPGLFAVSSIEGSVNVPLSEIVPSARVVAEEEGRQVPPDWLPPDLTDTAPIFVVCRVGNDSQVAVTRMKQMGLDAGGKRFIGDIRGGLKAWKEEVDETFPFI